MCVRTILVYGLLMFSRKPRLIYALKRLLAYLQALVLRGSM